MKKTIAVFAVALLAAGAGYWFWRVPERLVSSRAVVEGRFVPVFAAVSGQVRETYVAAGQSVGAGQPLFALDTSGYETQLAKERERLAKIATTLPGNLVVPSPTAVRTPQPDKPLAVLRVEENEARAAVEVAAGVLASANITLARMGNGAPGDPKRQAALIARDEAAISLQRARDAFEKNSYDRARREAQEKSAMADGTVSAALAARIAEYQAQISRVRLAEQDLAATLVVAPESGRVMEQTALPGAPVTAGNTYVTILPDKSQGARVVAFFPESAGAGLGAGAACEISFPGDGGREPVTGRIETVSSAPDAEKDIAVYIALDQNDTPLQVTHGQEAVVTVVPGVL